MPGEIHQKQWAPFLYFVPAIAGTGIGLCNKLGSWRLPINYAVKSACDFCFTVIQEHFKALMQPDDWRNASRYLENIKCRMVSHTLLKKTQQCMMNIGNIEVIGPNVLRTQSTVRYALNFFHWIRWISLDFLTNRFQIRMSV